MGVAKKPQIARILLIEDDIKRYEVLTSWLPTGIRLVWAKDAGAAMGIIRRTKVEDYVGMMLDFNLVRQPYVTGGPPERFDGGHVVDLLQNRRDLAREVPVLVHSNNLRNGPVIAKRLEGSGYMMTRIAMRDLTKERFIDWIEGLDLPA